MKKVDEQALDCLHEEARRYLLKYLRQGVYSAASLAVATHGKDGYTDCSVNLGRAGEKEEYRVDSTTFFDLASLTKPLATLPSILHLVDERKISWNEPLESLLERNLGACFKKVELHSLLSHSSGFTAHRNYWKQLISIGQDRKSEWLLRKIVDDRLEYHANSRHLYSDVGYLLLGNVVEVKSGMDLDHYWKTHIAGPAGLAEKLAFRPQGRRNVVSTGYCPWSKDLLSGLVHDDNCRALGGVGGHAGLFGSAEGVIELCKEYLNLLQRRKSKLPLSSGTFRKAAVRVGDSDWSCGFSLPSITGSSSGTYFSADSIGHLGFTGVSFWIDVDKQVIVSLLTNRVRGGDDMSGIKEARPVLHDVVMGCLQGKKNPPAEPGEG